MGVITLANSWRRRAAVFAGTTFLLVLLGTLAYPQSTIDPGEVCIQNLGYLACSGAGRGGGGAPANYVHFAAIALSPSQLRTGSSHGQPSQTAAVNKALQNCRSFATDCTIVASGSACYAVAIHYPGGPYKVGTGANRSQAAANAQQAEANRFGVVSAPCAGDDVTWSAPLPLPVGLRVTTVDPNAVGTWFNNRNPGRWIWTVGRNGAYEFHSEAPDNATSNTGTIEFHGSSWSLTAFSMKYSDQGTYNYVAPGTLNMTGQHGTITWRRMGR